MEEIEKLGAFYLGRLVDPATRAASPAPLLYDAKDLTTHAVIVGMTGSGKTGLGTVLLEEAALDGIPSLVIDPKGDMGNLLLTFPDLAPSDFEPWVDPAEAARAGVDRATYAERVASRWRKGLAEWGQGPERIRRLRAAADLAIYTPGSDAGLPVAALRSFAAPPPAVRSDRDALAERVVGAVSALLGLVGLEADPIQSREHILLARIVEQAWAEGRDLDVPSLIAAVQSPPFSRLGVMDLESVFPARDRFGLAMRLNNLLASPSFAAWREGEPLDVDGLLWTADGRPRVAILSIAHLSDAERMFFVTLLLNEIVGWVRGQSGTASLRAVLYMDEIFGYFPPTAEPPSKRPMLTLLKQARAYGLGVVLATQNPVDLDYKGLANTGTWLVGRLQTARDKSRVVEGLEAAAAGARLDRERLETLLGDLAPRVFLMRNVHEDEPVLFQTRWALSYLRGPLTRDQIARLMAERKAAAARPVAAPAAAPAASERPVLPPEIEEVFLPVDDPTVEDERIVYRAALLATARLHYVAARQGVDHWETISLLVPLDEDGPRWEEAEATSGPPPAVADEPRAGARFVAPPAVAARPKRYPRWEKELARHLYRERTLSLWKSPELGVVSAPGESEAAFRARVRHRLREKRDEAVERLRGRYAPKLERLRERIRRAEERRAREEKQYAHEKLQTAISFGATLVGALLGRKIASTRTVGRATTAARAASRAAREREDIGRVEEEIARLEQEYEKLDATLREEMEEAATLPDPAAIELEAVSIRPRKADIVVGRLALAWVPWREDDGGLRPAYRWGKA